MIKKVIKAKNNNKKNQLIKENENRSEGFIGNNSF
jgi:hypothetical protein